jgi:hypothetical protein
VKTYIEKLLTDFSSFYQTIFIFLITYSLQHFFHSLRPIATFSPTKHILSPNDAHALLVVPALPTVPKSPFTCPIAMKWSGLKSLLPSLGQLGKRQSQQIAQGLSPSFSFRFFFFLLFLSSVPIAHMKICMFF